MSVQQNPLFRVLSSPERTGNKYPHNDQFSSPSFEDLTQVVETLEVLTEYEPKTKRARYEVDSSSIVSVLPSAYDRILLSKGIKNPYEWQRRLLKDKKFTVDGRHLVYSTPTSAGKSLVAEALLMCSFHRHSFRLALYVLPFVSIVEEKVSSLREFARDLSFGVEAYCGAKGSFPVNSGKHRLLLVATIEKANAIICSLMSERRLEELGCVVVDELHMVGEGDRGTVLESMICKIKVAAKHTQIVGMTATIGNLDEIASWLDAEKIVEEFRPVPLKEYTVCRNGDVMDIEHDSSPVRSLSCEDPKTDRRLASCLCEEVIPTHSVLVFCPTKRSCGEMANILRKYLPVPTDQSLLSERNELLVTLKTTSPVDDCTKKCIMKGISVHHSGITVEERNIIEESFRKGVLVVLCCTSTLAAGVNLPARRVIVLSTRIGRDVLNWKQYKQMCGRAGRAGLDSFGESYLISNDGLPSSLKLMDSCTSQLTLPSIKKLVLECICCDISGTMSSSESISTDSLGDIAHNSLLCKQQVQDEVLKTFEDALSDLVESKLLEPINEGVSKYKPSRLGEAVFRSSLPIDDALFIYREMKKAQEDGIILETDLHLCYLSTPVKCIQPDWKRYLHVLGCLDTVSRRVATRVGVDDGFIVLLAHQLGRNNPDDPFRVISVRFFNALILSDICSEVSLDKVAFKYNVERGQIQQLMLSSSSFSSCCSRICGILEWPALESVVQNYSQRVAYGVRSDLLPLMDIRGVGRSRARMLYRAGLSSPEDVAVSDIVSVCSCLNCGEMTAQMIIMSARRLLQRRVDELELSVGSLGIKI